MSTSTAVKSFFTLIAAGTSNAAAAATRGAADLRTTMGEALVTVKLTTGGTGPTAQANARVLVAHDTGATPATAAAGAVWKTIATLGGSGTTASTTYEYSYRVPRGALHVMVEVADNTGQAVTCEAFAAVVASISTV